MSVDGLFTRILVGVDADGHAAQAAHRGARLARQLGSHLELIHAVEVPPPMWPGIDQDKLASMHAETLVRARAKVIKTLAPVVDVPDGAWKLNEHLQVLPGHAAKVLLERAVELEADLILLGPHVKRGVFDFGSTARAVLSRSHAPVWMQAHAVKPIERILVPVDFSSNSLRALGFAQQLALCLGASLTVLHCYAPPAFAYGGPGEATPGPVYVIDEQRKFAREALEELMSTFDWGDVVATERFVEGEPGTTAVEEGKHADLIVIGTQGRTGLSRFLLGSVAYSVLKHAETPVLGIPNPGGSWQMDEGGSEGEKRPVATVR